MKISKQTRLRLFGLGENVADSTPTKQPTESAQEEPHTPPLHSTSTIAPVEISFSNKEYAEVWDNLVEAIGEKSCFAGSVTSLHGGFRSTLTATLIIHRVAIEGASVGPISNIVPVWWEMTTHTLCDPSPTLNDFSFSTLLLFRN